MTLDEIKVIESAAEVAVVEAHKAGMTKDQAWEAVRATGMDERTAWDFVLWQYNGTASDLVDLAAAN